MPATLIIEVGRATPLFGYQRQPGSTARQFNLGFISFAWFRGALGDMIDRWGATVAINVLRAFAADAAGHAEAPPDGEQPDTPEGNG